MTGALVWPQFNPVAFELGPLAIHWYGLAYAFGLIGGWWVARRAAAVLIAQGVATVSEKDIDDFLLWAALGVVVGGRLGYALFYRPTLYLTDPLEILKVWKGGMSFHGGLCGMVTATLAYARLRGLAVTSMADLVSLATPIGLFFGRVANFVNGELWGRPSNVPWAVVFPHVDQQPRHPSQLYEAGLEGLGLMVLTSTLFWASPRIRARPGLISGVFLMGYSIARFTVEFFREPDAFLGFLWWRATMGQLLSLPMIVIGATLTLWALLAPRRRARERTAPDT